MWVGCSGAFRGGVALRLCRGPVTWHFYRERPTMGLRLTGRGGTDVAVDDSG